MLQNPFLKGDGGLEWFDLDGDIVVPDISFPIARMPSIGVELHFNLTFTAPPLLVIIKHFPFETGNEVEMAIIYLSSNQYNYQTTGSINDFTYEQTDEGYSFSGYIDIAAGSLSYAVIDDIDSFLKREY